MKMVSQFGVAGGDDNPKTSRLSSPLRWGLYLRFVVAGGGCINVTEGQFFKAGAEMALLFLFLFEEFQERPWFRFLLCCGIYGRPKCCEIQSISGRNRRQLKD